jgi:hypothetical protein
MSDTRSVESGERWIAAQSTESEHSDREYVLRREAEDESIAHRSDVDATPDENVTYRSGATIHQFGPDGAAVSTCGGNVTCHTQLPTE